MTLRTSHMTSAGLSAMTDAIRVARDHFASSSVGGFGARNREFDEALSRNGADTTSPDPTRSSTLSSAVHPSMLAATDSGIELAIQGDGYLAVSGEAAGQRGTFFLQRGQFRTSPSGAIVTAGNLALLGRPLLADGSLASSVAPLTVSLGGLPARSTTRLAVAANLDASQATRDAGGSATASLGLSATAEVYDALGRAQTLRLHFSPRAEGEWHYRASADAAELDPTRVANDPAPGLGHGTLSFSSEGLLEAVHAAQPIEVAFRGAGAQRIELSFGEPLSDGGDGLSGVTAFSMPSAVSRILQDGSAAGVLSGFEVLPDGMVECAYSNGQRQPVGQVVVAQFRTNELARAGQGVFAQTAESGQAMLGGPGRNGRGTVSVELEPSGGEPPEASAVIPRPQRALVTSAQVMAGASDMLSMLMMSGPR